MIQQYNELIDQIVKEYLTKLCKDIYNEELEEGDYRIMDYQGILQGPVEFSGMYFSIDDILMAYNHNIHGKIFVSYYEHCLDCYKRDVKPGINLYNYWRKQTIDSRILEEEKKEELKRSEEAVKQCYNELKKG